MGEVMCADCGALVRFGEGEQLISCGNCRARLLIDDGEPGICRFLSFGVDREQALAAYQRWAGSPMMAADLVSIAKITRFEPLYFPVFLYTVGNTGSGRTIAKPARSTTMPGLHSLDVPVQQLQVFRQDSLQGDVGLLLQDLKKDVYAQELGGATAGKGLVYFPLWVVDYDYKKQAYEAVIDGSSGKVFSGDYPAGRRVPYLLIASVVFVLFSLGGYFSLASPQWLLPGIAVAAVSLPLVFLLIYSIIRRFKW